MRACVAALLLALSLAGPSWAGEVLAVRAGRILTMAGPAIEHGTVVIEEGRIVSVAPGDAVPEGARLLDMPDAVVIPGMIDASALFAVRGDANEQAEEITPDFVSSPTCDPASPAMRRALEWGITTVRLAPGSANVIGGEGSLWKTAGGPLGARPLGGSGELSLVLADDPAWDNDIPSYARPTHFHFRQPTTRMGVVWLLRQALFGAQHGPAETRLGRLLAGEVPLFALVRTAVDLETFFQFTAEFGLTRPVIEGCIEGWEMPAMLREHEASVILAPVVGDPRSGRSGGEGRGRLSTAAVLSEAGVPVALGSQDAAGPSDLRAAAAMALRGGLTEEAALASVTSTPAAILRISDRVGSLAPGKDGDLVILSGSPLAFTTRVCAVIVDGRVAYDETTTGGGDD